jgi:type IV fimbrial biogenesis protein FimT
LNIIKCSAGLTIMELLVVIAIIGIILVSTGLTFNTYLANTRLSEATNQLEASLLNARSVAINRHVDVTLCISNTASTDCDGGAFTVNWNNGWLVFEDHDTKASFGANDKMLAIIASQAPSLSITNNGFTKANSVQFDNTGKPGSAGSFFVCDNRAGEQGKQITISSEGGISVSDFNCP